jgi:iron complex transport system substrate-binding protein
MRLISLVCSNTEIVASLGLASHLVGVDDHSDYPESALEGLPRLGPELDINVSRVQELRPDLVLASLSVPGQEKVVGRLEATGLPILVLDPTSLFDVFADIRTVAEALGVPGKGEVLVGDMELEFAKIRREGEEADTVPRRPTVLVEWWPKPVIAPGRLSWVQDLLVIAGARNPLGKEEVRSRPMSDEEVALVEPDAVVLSWCGVDPVEYRTDVVANNPLWSDVPAVRNGQIHCVPEAYLGRPGPRLVEGAWALRAVVSSLFRATRP